MNFENVFKQELKALESSEELISIMWADISRAYSAKGRYYHNLTHLDQLVAHLSEVRKQIQDWPAIVFAIAWHDAVYQTSKSDNEEKSAEKSDRNLTQTFFPEQRREKCIRLILATKKHLIDEDEDVNLFTDADLAILGTDEEAYFNYARQIRKEYWRYPDFLYKPGRKKVLKHFQEMESIYKTTYFRNKFEQSAKRNIDLELRSL